MATRRNLSNICRNVHEHPVEEYVARSDSPQLLFRDCQEERVDHNGTYLDVLTEPWGTPRDPESGNNNQLSLTRSEHLDRIAGPPGVGLPDLI